jgi:hypothetical protein
MICSTEIEKLAEKLAKMKMAATGGHKSCVLNAPGTTRTCDLLVRSQMRAVILDIPTYTQNPQIPIIT